MDWIAKIIGTPLGWIMWGLYALIKNYGVTLVVFTIIVRACMFPLSIKQQKSTARTTLLAPKLEQLKKKYANNKEKLQEETMKLYQDEGINPMGGCGTTLIQLPLFIGIIEVVRNPLTHICRISSEFLESAKQIASGLYGDALPKNFEYQSEIFIMEQIKSNPDAFAALDATELTRIAEFKNTFLGYIDLGLIPTFQPPQLDASYIAILLIPIVTGILQILMTFYSQRQMKRTNPAAQNMGGMNIMMYGMSIFYIYMLFSYPAGLGLYWLMSALLSLVQTLIMHKVFTPEKMAEIVAKEKATKKNTKKKTLMQRLMEQQALLEAQQKAQSGDSQSDGDGEKIITTATPVYDENGNIKLSKSQMKNVEKQLISDARRRMAEKYGDDYSEDDD